MVTLTPTLSHRGRGGTESNPICRPDFLEAFCSWVHCRLNSYARKSALFRIECSTRRNELLQARQSKGAGFCIHLHMRRPQLSTQQSHC